MIFWSGGSVVPIFPFKGTVHDSRYTALRRPICYTLYDLGTLWEHRLCKRMEIPS